jgi:uncharacterized membrane protein
MFFPIAALLLLLAVAGYQFSALQREQQILRRMLRTLEARVSQLESRSSQTTLETDNPQTISEPRSVTEAPPVIAAELTTTPLVVPSIDPWISNTTNSNTTHSNASDINTKQAAAITFPDTYQEPQPSSVSQWPLDFRHLTQYLTQHRWVRYLFADGNSLARIGVALVFIGAALLIKLAADHGLLNIPIAWRLTAVGLGGLFLIGLGWRLRNRASQSAYALSLQGGGLAIIYLTLFAALRLFHLMPTSAALVMMLLLCVLSAWLAIKQNTQVLAIIATCGGFLAPIVTSNGDGSHVALFSYYALLNASIVAMAWYRTWRLLNLLGFAFTLVISSAWGVLKYDSALWSSTQPFLILFFLFYVVLSVLFALRQPINLRGYIDGTLVFGTPIIGFALQASLVNDFSHGLTYSAISLCVFYTIVAYLTFRFAPISLRLLSESFLAIGSIFGTLAIPLSLDNQGTVAAWALEGVALIYVSIRQSRRYACYCGILLQLIAGVLVLAELIEAQHSLHWPLINSAYLSGLIMAIAGLISGYLLHKSQPHPLPQHRSSLPSLSLAWGIGWWLITHFYEIAMHNQSMNTDHWWQPTADAWLLLLGSTSTLLAHLLGKQLRWPALHQLGQTGLIFMMLALLINLGDNLAIAHPLTAIAWIISFICFYALLSPTQIQQTQNPDDHHWQPISWQLNPYQHGGAIWLGVILIGWQMGGWLQAITHLANTWGFSCRVWIPGAALLLIEMGTRHINWPFKQHALMYRQFVSTPIAAGLIGLILLSIFTQVGNSTPLPYFPLLNPLDLSILSGFVCLWMWYRQLTTPPFQLSITRTKVAFAIMVFFWINSALLRALHHGYGLSLSLAAIIDSNLAQTCLTLLWSSIAMLMMFISSARGQRNGWIAGASLLAIVVVKLFLLDLGSVGSVTRIISFMFVGILMLVIGYFRPLPPRLDEPSTNQSPSVDS